MVMPQDHTTSLLLLRQQAVALVSERRFPRPDAGEEEAFSLRVKEALRYLEGQGEEADDYRESATSMLRNAWQELEAGNQEEGRDLLMSAWAVALVGILEVYGPPSEARA